MRPWAEIAGLDEMTHPSPVHNIIFEEDTKRYRCQTCRAVAFKRHIIDEIPCTKAATQTFTEVSKRGAGEFTWVYAEPFLPRFGDTWLDRSGLYVYVETRSDGYGWLDVTTGTMKPGQGHLPGGGINPNAKQLSVKQVYSEELLHSKALGVDADAAAKEQVGAMLVKHCIERNVIQVTPTQWASHVNLSIKGWTYEARCMAVPRPQLHP